MVTEVLELQVRTTGTAQSKAQLDGLAESAKLAANTMALLRNALVLVGAFRIGQGFVEFIDKFDAAKDKIAPFTEDAEQLRGVMGNLGRVALDTAQEFGRVSDVYTKLAPAAASARISQQALLDATRGFTATLVANGKSLEDANSAATQLGASLRRGSLDTRSWTSLVKNASPVADILAKSVNKSVGEISNMIAKNPGILTTADVFKALADSSEGASKKLGDTVDSISDGFNRISIAAQFFFGQLAEATGVGKSGLDFLTLLAENIDKVVLAAAGLAAIGTLGFVFSNLATILGGTVAILRTVISTMSIIIPIVTGLSSVISVLTSVVLANPIFIGAAAIALAGFLVYMALTDTAFSDLIPTMGQVTAVLNGLIATFAAGGALIVEGFSSLPSLLAEIFQTAVNGAIEILEFLVKAALSVVNRMVEIFSLGFASIQSQIDSIDFDAAKLRGAEGAFARLGSTVTKTFDDVYKSNPVQSVINFGKTAFDNVQTFLGKLKIPSNLPVPGLVAPGGGGGGIPDAASRGADKEREKIERLTNEIQSAIGRFDPYIKGIAEMDKFHTLLGKNAEVTRQVLAKLGITQEEVNRRMVRDLIGVGNAVTDMEGKMRLLEEAYARGDVSASEYAKALRDIAGAATGIIESVSPLIAAQNKYSDALQALNDAEAAGIDLGIEKTEVLKRLLREQVGVGNAAVIAAEQTELLNNAWKQGAISAKEYEDQLRKIRIAELQTRTDAASGFELGILKVQDEYLNTAKDAEQTITNMFDNLQGTLEEFFSTGKLNFSKLVDGILADLTKLAIKGAITGPLAKLLGGGGFDGSTGAETDPLGGIFGAIFGGFKSGAEEANTAVTTGLQTVFRNEGTNLVDGMKSAFTNEGKGWLDGLLSIFSSSSGGGGGGGGGGLGGIFDFIGGLFGGGGGAPDPSTIAPLPIDIPFFAEGGSAMVDGAPGRDRNFVGLRVSKGERIDVLTPEQQIRQAQKMGVFSAPTINFHITTPDADSFRRSQGQIGAMAAQGLQRAQARNG